VSVLPMKVLVTGAGALLGQGILRALKRSSAEIEVACADPSPLSAGLYWTDEAYLLKMASDPDYISRLGEVLARAKPDILIPGTDSELSVLAAHRDRLLAEFGTQVLVSDARAVAIADDKFMTFEFLRDSGFPAPPSARGEDGEAIDELVRTTGFPLVVKPRTGARSVGVSIVGSRRELDQALKNRSGLVVQECVGDDSDEYTASVLVFDGEAKASIVMRRDLRDGNTYRAFSGAYPELNTEVKRFGVALNPFGPANFQFRLDSQGRACVFEINCRFSGATPLRALVGFNEVEMCLLHILRNEPIVEPEVQEATILRHWSETLVEPSRLEQLR
jgi:carbamoyl-phosphate synthase large subunit